MKPLIVLDFDGVLFNSAFEAYQVCQETAEKFNKEYQLIDFDTFMEFRAVLTDAWQFNRLYSKESRINDFKKLRFEQKNHSDELFAKRFFETRKEMMESEEWPKLMAPYPFFFQIKDLINSNENLFKILSTRNKESIERTLLFYGVNNIEIFSQEDLLVHGSKISVAKSKEWFNSDKFIVYVDDMQSHLEPFMNEVALCIHAGWGYDSSGESYTQSQVAHLLDSFIKVGN